LDVEELSAIAVDCGLQVHRDLGPGMLESAYEAVLAHLLSRKGLAVERQKIIPIQYDGIVIDQGFRADLVVDGQLLIELKAVERLSSVHGRQVLTYLKFMNLPVGLLMNFSTDLFRDGLKRIVNKHAETDNSRLAINRNPSRLFAPSRSSREIEN
jgi:GxxExxY protein